MNTKGFELIEKRFHEAKCVEDVFGERPPTNKRAASKIVAELKTFKKRVRSSNSNLHCRIDLLLNHYIPFFAQWAWDQWLFEEYGSRAEYPLEISFTVKNHEGRKMFCMRGEEESVTYISQIHAINFIGYWHHDKVIVILPNKKECVGEVTYYGTHAAQEYFYKVNPDREYENCLWPKMFKTGTVIKIQTWAFFSLGEFLAKVF